MNFCTLFNQVYLTRGLALWSSLRKHAPESHLWVLCMDAETERILRELQLPGLTPISLSAVEDADLLKAKGNRSAVEYCWTCSPILPLYLLKTQPKLESITYIDADVFFFDSPRRLFDELGSGSILIFEHKFPPKKRAQALDVGTYNVEVIVFRNDANSLECLNGWRERCLEWCYDRIEPGRMGDQKYLDEWPSRFQGVVVASDRTPGLAPWNFETYSLSQRDGHLFAEDAPVLFCHFSKLWIQSQDSYHHCRGYRVPGVLKSHAYRPYTNELTRQLRAVRERFPDFSAVILPLSAVNLLKDAFFKFRVMIGVQ